MFSILGLRQLLSSHTSSSPEDCICFPITCRNLSDVCRPLNLTTKKSWACSGLCPLQFYELTVQGFINRENNMMLAKLFGYVFALQYNSVKCVYSS